MTRRLRLAARLRLEPLDRRLVLSSLTPSQVQAAYGLNAITFSSGKVAGTGAGQTIAIIDAYNDPNAVAELKTFDSTYSLPAANLTVDNLGSAGNTNAGWEEEEALDIEAAHTAAPGAKILLIEAKTDSIADLMAAVGVANATSGVTVVSMSWGGSDTRNETAYDSAFTHTGITYLAASGDDGSGAEWPSDSPDVIAVGGTSLAASTSGRVAEVAWAASGGGTSRVESEPSYQTKVQSTGLRTTPNVSAVADPNTGLEVYTQAGGGWVQVGGTSLSTPIWAGLIAVADQGRALAGKATLSSTQALGDLYQAPTGSFNDITTGSRTATGYDTSTGLGTPNAATLVAALVADPSTGVGTFSSSNGDGGDPVTTTNPGGGTSPGTRPTPPLPPRWGRFWGFNDRTVSSSQSSGSDDWASAYVPKNSGQAASIPDAPIRLVQTSPKVTLTRSSATLSASAMTTFDRLRIVDAIIEASSPE